MNNFSFNPHINILKYVLLSPSVSKKTEIRDAKCLAKVTKLVNAVARVQAQNCSCAK